MKRTTCFICKKKLTGIKTKFCGDVCYSQYKAKADHDMRMNRRKQLPDRKCLYCGVQFLPIRADHIACGKVCSGEHSKHLQNIRRLKRKPMPKIRPLDSGISTKTPANPQLITLVTKAEFNPGSTFRDQVLKYLKGGGKISRMPDEPQARTPSVNVRFGYTPSELCGSAMEYELSPEANVSAA